MNKVNKNSLNYVTENIKKLKELFPEAVTEDKINKEILLGLLGEQIDNNNEKYEFTWNGKSDAIKLSQMTSTGTLLPCREKSVDWDNTENIYIEGDNLEVLKILQRSYNRKVKMIYIDPPYNTGNDFIYKDDFKDSIKKYREQTNQAHKANAETSGRYHTDWLNMMYPRLRLAKNLLTDDGVIFISIDDNEVTNLSKICNEIFGEKNFITKLIWEKKKKGAFLSKNFINMKEYILVYVKDINSFNGLVGEINESSETYPCIKTTNARGIRKIKAGTVSKYKEKNYILKANTRISSGNMELIYLDDLVVEKGILKNDVRVDSNWIYSQKAMDEYADNGLLYITQDNYIRRIVDDKRTKMLKDLLLRVGADGKSLDKYEYDDNLNNGGWGTNEDANEELHRIFGEQYIFDYAKPSRLIAKLIQSISDKDCIIMDFFSGSATTADAIMQINNLDKGKRKYILVQLPEKIEDSKFNTICEIGEERIRKQGNNIKGAMPNIDTGFRVFKLDSSNIKEWNSDEINKDNASEYFQTHINPIVEGRATEDLLYEIILKEGMLLSASIEKINIEGKLVYSVDRGHKIICLEDEITIDLVRKIGKMKPNMVVFKDQGFKDENTKINAVQELKKYGIAEENIKSI